jgi:hypothetical protein
MSTINYFQCDRYSLFGVTSCAFNIVAFSGNENCQTCGGLTGGGGHSNGN